MFYRLTIETSSYCNRRCATCLRQINPDREAVKSWFTQNLLPSHVIYGVLGQAIGMGYRGKVSFNYYNEPLLDSRLPDFGRYAKRLGFEIVMFATNGDFLDEAMAGRLDGHFDSISVSLYEDNTKDRREQMKSWFAETQLRFTNGLHFRIHDFEQVEPDLAEINNRRCPNASRNVVVNHRGDFLLCCQEIVPHFNLGSVYDIPLIEMWEAKEEINQILAHTGGRKNYPYCTTCLRGSNKEYVKVIQNESLCHNAVP
jgi:radical SAM protein with 4Fe4S-binding SPASM domain